MDKERSAFLDHVLESLVEEGADEDFAVGVYSLSNADPHVLCVLPKQQTPSVGCTLRSLSLHLALLPPIGPTRADWLFTPHRDRSAPLTHAPLNLVLVPWPYEVRARAFRALAPRPAPNRWGWFELETDWIGKGPSGIPAFLHSLIEEARKDVREVHGIIFPELSMDWTLFRELALRLNAESDVEFLVAGTTEDQSGQAGNFVTSAYFKLLREPNDEQTQPSLWDRSMVLIQRAKHHRWKLTKNQIRDYALGSALDPDIDWWEHIPLPRRDVNFVAIRPDTVLTTMVCEDLARIDPCHSIVRSVGPSMVIALLMDGPQLPSRWPGRYATSLADDPGCAVLTLTSLALLERQNASGAFPNCRTVALWKDEVAGFRELVLPVGYDALCISLAMSRTTDRSLDGRLDTRNSLTLGGVRPIRSAMRP